MTRRDRCYLTGIRAAKLSPTQAARAWASLGQALEQLGLVDMPKFKHLLSAIRKATIIGKCE